MNIHNIEFGPLRLYLFKYFADEYVSVVTLIIFKTGKHQIKLMVKYYLKPNCHFARLLFSTANSFFKM